MLDAQRTTLDGLPADVAKEYVKGENGVFTLGVAPVNGYALEDIGGLKTALGKERDNARTAKAALEAFGDLDVTKAKEAIAKVAEMANWTPEEKVKQQMDATAAQLNQRHSQEMEKVKTTVGEMSKHLQKRVIEGDAIAAILKEGGNPALLAPIVTKQMKMALVNGEYVGQVIDEAGVVRVSMATGSTDSMTVAELVASMKANETFAPAFAGSGASGGGAGNSSGAGNASGSDTISRTEARNSTKYRAARERAQKAGRRLIIVD